MKELDFNTENSVKVAKVIGHGIAEEYVLEAISTKITGKESDRLIEGMARASLLLVDILTKETKFRDALKYIYEKGITIE